MKAKSMRRIEAALTGITLAESWPSRRAVVELLDRTRPPSYLVRATLERVFGYRLPSVHDKSAWAAPLSYKGFLFEISDLRRSVWRIRGPEAAVAEAGELAKKISAAASILNGYIKEICRNLRATDDYSLDNQFHRYRTLFEMFRAESTAQLETRSTLSHRMDSRSATLRDLDMLMSASMERSSRLQASVLAAAIFFFSLTEVIFDACFALGDRKGMNYHEFRKLDWSQRFKLFLAADAKGVKTLYDKLLVIRRDYRNVPVHGGPIYLFSINGVGLVPASFDALDNPNIRPLFFGDEGDAVSVLDGLDASLRLFEDHPKTRFGFAYAESGLAIHIARDRLMEHKHHMKSLEDFREFLNGLNELRDAVEDMEV